MAYKSSDVGQRQRDYWASAEVAFDELTADSTGTAAADEHTATLSHEPKVHILHGEHLEASGRADEAQAAFCRSYRASSEGVGFFGAQFYARGVGALQEASRDLMLAQSYLAMAVCVDPGHTEAAAALGVVRDALQIVRERELGARTSTGVSAAGVAHDT